MSLHLGTTAAGEPFTLPLEAQTVAFAIVGRRGSGKTNLAVVMVEEMVKAGLSVCVLDVLGVWWGLRSSADGEGVGLPVTILGGAHGDVPIEPTAGSMIANFIVEHPGAFVVDLSGFATKSEEDRFAADFAHQLYRRKATDNAALHLVIDEADNFAPQNPQPGQQKMLGAFNDISRRGRVRGLAPTLITQRPAALNKNVLSQSEVLVAMQITAPQDRAALKEWVRVNGDASKTDEFLNSLAQLQVGEGWLWSPSWLDTFERINLRRRETFDSSATPKAGETRVEPRVLAPVDLETLREAMAATIEKAAADDPKALRAEIARLKATLAKNASVVACDHEPLIESLQTELERQAGMIAGFRLRVADALGGIKTTIETILEEDDANPGASVVRHNSGAGGSPSGDREGGDGLARTHRPDTTGGEHTGQDRRRTGAVSTVAQPRSVRQGEGRTGLAKAERSILAALAPYAPNPRTKRQVALLTGYAINGGGFNNAIGALRSKGYVVGGTLALSATTEGLDALGEFDPLPTGVALLEHWQGQLAKAERTILGVLYAAYPASLTKEELGARAGYEPTGGGFNNAMGKLRTLELIERGAPRLSDDLVDGA